MRSPVGRSARFVAAVASGLVLLGACTGGDESPDPDPATSAGQTESAEPDAGWTADELATAVLEGDLGTSEVLGSVRGAVPDPRTPYPATVEVTEVRAGAESTLVRFTLRGLDDSDPVISLEAFNAQRPLTRDIRDVALVDATANQRLQPFIGVPTTGGDDVSLCTCSTAPLQMSTAGQLLSATFPPLDPGTTTVALELPGFPVVEDLPVTRD